MFFWAFRGDAAQAQQSQQQVEATARRRLEQACFKSFDLSDDRHFVIGWLGPRMVDPDQHIQVAGDDVLVATIPRSSPHVSGNGESAALFSANLGSGTLTIETAATSPEQIHYAVTGDRAYFSNDVRLLREPFDGGIDPDAVFAVLQIGAIPAPISIWRGVRRLPPGSRLTVAASGEESHNPLEWSGDTTTIPPTEGCATVEARLRKVLPTPGAGPVALFFSGGVDSSLLASELRLQGHEDVTLVNYAFSSDDPDADVAQEIASRIGFPLRRLDHEDASIEAVLNRIGKDYSYPFGDVSTLPTNAMVHAVSENVSPESHLIEGTGADGIFGLNSSFALWRRFAGAPAILRWAGALAYERFGLWRSGGAVRKTCWMFRTLSQMPLLQSAVLSQNSLDGIAYSIPDASKDALSAAIDASYLAAIRNETLENRASVLDLMHVCSGIFAAKSFDPIRSAGFRVLYPFLTAPMVELATRMAPESKFRGGIDKLVLKDILRKTLPSELVDRPKRGFDPPMGRYLQTPVFQAYLRDTVLSPSNPILDFVDPTVIRRMIDYAGRRPLANREVHNFLWSLTFLTAWIQSQR